MQGDQFSQNLYYNSNPLDPSKVYYNGNIGGMQWTNHDIKGEGIQQRGYSYDYDGLNRLTDAKHYQDGSSTPTNFDVSIGGFDLNGNILSLTRNGSSGSAMDDLSYNYVGNQLQWVNDTSGDTLGFNNNGTDTNIDYLYDANGNMTQDLNKGITSISYDHNNMMKKVVFQTTGDSITYLYDAAGIKLQEKVYEAGTLEKTTDYVGDFTYEDGELQSIKHEEGRIVPKTDDSNNVVFDYQYNLVDHLGNVRVTFSTLPENYTMIETFESGEDNGWQDLHRSTNSNAICLLES